MLNSDALSQLKQLKKDIHSQRNIATGKVKGSNARFGFVTLNEGGKDIYLSPEQMTHVLPGDEVEIEIFTDAKNKEYGEVLRLLGSELNVFVAELKTKNKVSFAEPHLPNFNRWLYIPPNRTRHSEEGDFIKCKLSQHPYKSGKPQVEVLERLGKADKTGIERDYSLARYDIRDFWSKEVKAQIKDIQSREIVLGQRADLREVPFVTIDSATTEDMDDALYASQTDTGWNIKVAIADPTEFIDSDSPIEREAFRRGTSIYLPGAPISMLPSELTRSLASLVANEDRYALVCDMQITQEGEVTAYALSLALIRSIGKLSYEQVASWIEDHSVAGVPEAAHSSLTQLTTASKALKQWRLNHTNVREEQPDYRIVLNSEQKIDHIAKIIPGEAHQIVEECMIAANVCAARFMSTECKHGLYITHQGIRADRRENIGKILAEKINAHHGTDLQVEQLNQPERFTEFSQLAERTPDENALRTIINRQLERSELSLSPKGHCGMGFPLYTNFTSPIRKFGDFYVQRLIKHTLTGTAIRTMNERSLEMLQDAQLRARQSVGYMEGWLKAQYAESLKDQVFDAKIVRSISSGFFVRLNETGIEGFVSTKDMPDKYSFDQVYFTLISKKRGFKLDDPVRVAVQSIDPKRNQVLFILEEDIAPIQASETVEQSTPEQSITEQSSTESSNIESAVNPTPSLEQE